MKVAPRGIVPKIVAENKSEEILGAKKILSLRVSPRKEMGEIRGNLLNLFLAVWRNLPKNQFSAYCQYMYIYFASTFYIYASTHAL